MSSFTLGFKQVRGPERRHDKRLPLPVFTVRIEDREYQSLNWSLGGFLLGPLDFSYFIGENVIMLLKIDEQGSEMEIPGEIIRLDGEAMNFAVKFTEMNPGLYRFFEQAFTARFVHK